ncbi:IS110 family transposase [Alkalihalophilus marmarensis]|uniref:IS110 family transposase n=1 Tax=Alkalihalophilus marmarensis TaxID=521377 RepID=UPI002E1ABECA|nr:IS110 family transposase [Alkalihalophilus marmarensis]MED1603544.1 IS110 family transposase [Alkalihalophilus marmarensis]
MTYTLLNHIQGKIGSRWAQFVKENGVDQLLIVAVDAAKYTHKVLVANFYGDILIKPFEIDASESGFNRLKKNVELVMKEKGYEKVVLGIETTAHYYEDLVRLSHSENYHVRTINAASTAQERNALMNWSKTDNLDLMTIVQSVIHGRGTSNELRSGIVLELQKLTRARRNLVQTRTALENAIRVHLDQVFREFQGKSIVVEGKRRHIQPFSELFGKASRYVMRHCLHPEDLLSLGTEGLRNLSIEHNLKMREHSIEILLTLAKNSIARPKIEVEVDQFLLIQKLQTLELYDKQVKELEAEIEELFLETEGAVLLSVPGIGLVTGAELYAEMGDISDFDHAGQLIKLAGTNPTVKQSGGKKATHFGISKQGRRPFRNIVYQVGKSLAAHNPAMKDHYFALKDRGKHTRQAYIAIGNRMLRLAYSMIKKRTLYLSKEPKYTLIDELKKKVHSKYVKRFYEKHVA